MSDVHDPLPPSQPAPVSRRSSAFNAGGRAVHGVWVAGVALVALVGIVLITVQALPSAQKGQNIIAIAGASFGVIGAIVGAYFGVSSANRAAEIVSEGSASGKTARQRRSAGS
jgi:hypothetical protein